MEENNNVQDNENQTIENQPAENQPAEKKDNKIVNIIIDLAIVACLVVCGVTIYNHFKPMLNAPKIKLGARVETGFNVGDSFYAFNKETGVNNYAEIPGGVYCKEAGQFKDDMPSLKDGSLVSMQDANVIFNVTFNSDNNVQQVNLNGEPIAEYRYIALKNNYTIDSLNTTSTLDQVTLSGYKPNPNMKGIYTRIANDRGNIDMAEIENEYNSCKTFKDFKYLPYVEEFKTLFNYEALQLSEDANVNEAVTMLEKVGVKNPKDYFLDEMAIARQLYLLRTGKIDYFVIKYYGINEAEGNYCFIAIYTKPGTSDAWFDFD